MEPITIPGNLIRAAMECAAKQDVRTYLNGVTVEILPSGKAVIMGTDGHILFAGWTTLDGQEAPKNGTLPIMFTAPCTDLEAAIKADKGADLKVMDPKGDTLSWGRMTFGRMTDHKPKNFEWRNSVPGKTFKGTPESGEIPQFDLDLMVRSRKALGHVIGRHTPASMRRFFPLMRYGKTPDDAALMVAHEVVDALVVVMPLRSQDVPAHKDVPGA